MYLTKSEVCDKVKVVLKHLAMHLDWIVTLSLNHCYMIKKQAISESHNVKCFRETEVKPLKNTFANKTITGTTVVSLCVECLYT